MSRRNVSAGRRGDPMAVTPNGNSYEIPLRTAVGCGMMIAAIIVVVAYALVRKQHPGW